MDNTTTRYQHTTATFNTDTASHVLGVAPYTVGEYIRRGKLDALRTTGRAWRISAFSVATFLYQRDGSLAFPDDGTAFGGTIAPDIESLAVRLGLFAPMRGPRAYLDPRTMVMTTLYTPDNEEVEYHEQQLTL